VALARMIARNTTAGHRWLAENLKMRSAANVGQLLRLESERETNRMIPNHCRSGSRRVGSKPQMMSSHPEICTLTRTLTPSVLTDPFRSSRRARGSPRRMACSFTVTVGLPEVIT